MSRATSALIAAVDAIDPDGAAANDEVATDGADTASDDLVAWIDALALTLAAGLRVAAGLHRLPSPVAPSEPEVMDVEEVAAFLGVDRKTIYDYAGRGEIPCRRLGKRILFSRTALVAWLGSCKAASREHGE